MQTGFFSSLRLSPSAPSAIMRDEAKGAHHSSGKKLNRTARKKSLRRRRRTEFTQAKVAFTDTEAESWYLLPYLQCQPLLSRCRSAPSLGSRQENVLSCDTFLKEIIWNHFSTILDEELILNKYYSIKCRVSIGFTQQIFVYLRYQTVIWQNG